MAERLLLLEAAALIHVNRSDSLTVAYQLIIRGLSGLGKGNIGGSPSLPSIFGCNFPQMRVFVRRRGPKARNERGDMRRQIVSLLCFATLGSVFALGQDLANDHRDTRQDRQDLRQDRVDRRNDRQDLRSDRRDLTKDSRDLRNDVRSGDFKDARHDRQDLRKDRRDLRSDRRDLRKDRKDIRSDRKDLRADRRDIRADRRK